MGQMPIEELLKRCGSAYQLVLLAAKRAKELADGAPALVASSSRKATSVALEEILEGKVLYQSEEPAEGSGKKGRGKAKEKRAST